MRKRTLVLMVALTVLSALMARSASASAGVRAHEIWYNSPGPDNRTNASLNGEWVQLHNSATKAISLSGWTLRDAAGHVYHFPSSYKLAAGGSVKVHTGHGSNTQTNLYWGSGNYIWNNDGDTATVKRKDGSVADKCSYSDPNESGDHVFC